MSDSEVVLSSEDIRNVWRYFGHMGRGLLLPLVSRAQRCSLAFYSAQDSPYDYLVLNSAAVEKLG